MLCILIPETDGGPKAVDGRRGAHAPFGAFRRFRGGADPADPDRRTGGRETVRWAGVPGARIRREGSRSKWPAAKSRPYVHPIEVKGRLWLLQASQID